MTDVKPECELGYTVPQLKEILGDRFEDFGKWMRGQTMALCEGQKYDHELGAYVASCNSVAHGIVVYAGDLDRYLKGLPVID